MPTYSYACTECGNRFDVVQAFTDDALTTCDRCSGRLRKLFGSVGVVFKGSGFYRTDSRDARTASTNGHSKPDTSSGSGSGSSEKSGSADKSASSDSATSNGDGKSTAASKPAAATSTSS